METLFDRYLSDLEIILPETGALICPPLTAAHQAQNFLTCPEAWDGQKPLAVAVVLQAGIHPEAAIAEAEMAGFAVEWVCYEEERNREGSGVEHLAMIHLDNKPHGRGKPSRRNHRPRRVRHNAD